ncbi:MAG: Mini-ribonuclease 3 [Massiliimalia sp.]|jgi:ribonuclease-3 family protein
MIQPEKNAVHPNLYSPLVLAYMGDVVYEMLVREKMVLRANMPVNKLHKATVSWVRASAQSQGIALIEPMLTEEELAVYKRGRNASGNHVPKNADAQEYRRATGFEALFGYLYLNGQVDRIRELFTVIWENMPQQE